MTWDEFDARIAELAAKVDWPVDVIVGVVRGGVVPARCLAGKLAVRGMYCLNVAKAGGERQVTTSISTDLTGKNALLVEDVLESGASLIAAADYLRREKQALVKTAALYYLKDTLIIPDYSLGAVSEVPAFPWEE